MKIIEGTPEEVTEYLNKQENKKEFVFPTFPKAAKEGLKSLKQHRKENLKLYKKHWSHSKHEWVEISEMDSSYILNVLRKKLNENKAADLLNDVELLSLIFNLSDKLEEDL